MAKWVVKVPIGQHLKSLSHPFPEIPKMEFEDKGAYSECIITSEKLHQYLIDSASHQFIIEEVTA